MIGRCHPPFLQSRRTRHARLAAVRLSAPPYAALLPPAGPMRRRRAAAPRPGYGSANAGNAAQSHQPQPQHERMACAPPRPQLPARSATAFPVRVMAGALMPLLLALAALSSAPRASAASGGGGKWGCVCAFDFDDTLRVVSPDGKNQDMPAPEAWASIAMCKVGVGMPGHDKEYRASCCQRQRSGGCSLGTKVGVAC